MNLSALKTFAPAVRLQLMEAVTRKLDFVLTGDTADLRAMSAQRAVLRGEATRNRAGLVERVAYIWFNRLAALRFIDAQGWHPFGARVLTAKTSDETQPELLRLVRSGQLPAELAPHTDPDRLNRLLDGELPSPNPQAEVYRHLVLAACRFYHALLPALFEKLDDETELLLPDDLLTEHSVVHGFRTAIADADCAEVEILGWLYQFYISEKKDQVMARKSAVPTEDIPAVTQLFTPHWIVRYLVENSLGRLWLLNRPQSKLREKMPYYIEGEPEADFLKIGKPEEIKIIDPACGSGHMLTYAFDLLQAIYEEEGYAPSDIAGLILRHNLHGVEICDRAATLAAFALCMKARSCDKRFFSRVAQPQIIALQEVRFEEGELSAYFSALGAQPSTLHPEFTRLLNQFEEAKNFGSLIQPCLTEPEIQRVRSEIENRKSKIVNDADLLVGATHLKVLRVLEQAQALTQRYHVVVANPPYMGSGSMNTGLKTYAETYYARSQSDLFAMFIEANLRLSRSGGYAALITMHSWMFISSFEELRSALVTQHAFLSMIHLGPRAFDSIGGEVVQTTAFVLQTRRPTKRTTVFKRLTKGACEAEKRALFEVEANTYVRPVNLFECVPGKPFAYWASPSLLTAFKKGTALGELGKPRKGLVTLDDRRFTRSWWEVDGCNIALGCKTRNAAKETQKKWFPINKGGGFRRWFGFAEQVINWYRDGEELKSFIVSRYGGGSYTKEIRSEEYYFKPSITWGKINTTAPSFRVSPGGFIMGDAGPCIFIELDLLPVLGLLNSKVSHSVIELLCPTVNAGSGDISKIPVLFAPSRSDHGTVVSEAVTISRADWDNFETSWDFRDQPLLRSGLKGATLETSWRNWEAQSTAAIRRMQELETENNRLFITAYGLNGELSPEVPEEQITLARADARRDMAAFLSYAVGCMMGRYSLDLPGLILADAGATVQDYLAKVPKPTFVPDEDGILPVLDGEWFEDDIVSRFREFLRVTFGDATLNENIRFIEESLGRDLRKYFLTDFYKNHLQTYKKRPIYWLFRSPKGAFAALVYLHRMTRDTPNLILNRYLRDYLQKLRARLEHLVHAEATAGTAREKTAARKESDQLKKNLRECEEWERDVLLPLAQSRPELDLDDGVKVNYLKLGEALSPIPGLATKEED